MPDETDTLTTSQSSTQNFALDGIGEGKNNSSSGSQSAGQSEAAFLLNSVTNSPSSIQSLFEGPVTHSQTNFPNLDGSRRQIPVQELEMAGVVALTQVNSDSENKHYFINDDPFVFLEVISVDPATQTVTIETSYTQDELPLEDRIVSIPAGSTKYMGMYPFHLYNQELIKVYVNPSSNGLKFRAFKVM